MAVSEDAANLGPQQASRMLRAGILAFVMASLVTVLTVHAGAGPHVRGLLFVPYFFASHLLLTGFTRKCVVVARLGARLNDDGLEAVPRCSCRDRMSRAAWRVFGASVVLAAAATALVGTA